MRRFGRAHRKGLSTHVGWSNCRTLGNLAEKKHMNETVDFRSVLPEQRNLFYGGEWHEPHSGRHFDTQNPATGESLGIVAEAGEADIDAAVQSAVRAFKMWRLLKPEQRAKHLYEFARVLREHADELALLDAANCGNPVKEMRLDAIIAAAGVEYFAGLARETKGETLPMGPGVLNYSVREPYGVVARIVPYNHPAMFVAMRSGAPLAAGNTLIVKPPEQASLSGLRIAELIAEHEIFPPGVFNIITGARETGAALTAHSQVAKVALIGSVPAGRAVLRQVADDIKPATLELGGKNALVICPDANIQKAAAAAVHGMNFTWCGQSCGSTSRAFIHESVYDEVIEKMLEVVPYYKPGIPTDLSTTMGALITREHLERVESYVASAIGEGATLLYGGNRPNNPELKNGNFLEPTIFTDVDPSMKVASEEIFGPVASIMKWSDEEQLVSDVNSVEYGLTASIWTSDLEKAHRLATAVDVGYVWINNVSLHFIGANFGGYKHSGMGREEGLEELLSYTQIKNINVTLSP